jgi:hypothetical protein
LKIIYERLAQQGTVKRHISSGDIQRTILMGLMNKINTDGLGVVIDNITDAQLEIDSIVELQQTLTRINHYNQTQPPVTLEQIQNQLSQFLRQHGRTSLILISLQRWPISSRP